MKRYFSWKQWLEMKNILLMVLFLTNMKPFTSQDVNWWTGVMKIACGSLWCFYQLLFWWHPFTAEDTLVSKWFNAKFYHIYSDEKTNSTKSTSMDDLRVSSKFSANLNFGVKYPFKSKILANEMNLKTVCFGVLTQGLEPQTSSKQHKVSVSERERSRSEGQCINMGVKDKEAHRWERDREWDGGMSKAHVSGRGFARRRGGSMWMENEASLCHMQWRHSARLKPRPLPVPFSLTEMLNQSELAMSGWEFPG